MWIHLPQSLCSPATEESIWDSRELSREFAQYATWRGKSSPPQTWSQRLKRVKWMRLLSGATSKHSTVLPGLEKWICSMGVTPAKGFRQRVSAKEKEILDSYGLGSSGQLSLFGLTECSSKMLRGTSRLDSPQSSVIWKRQVIDARGEYLARKSAALRTEGSGCSSLGNWPTIQASEGEKAPKCFAGKNPSLTSKVKNWQTIRSHEVGDYQNQKSDPPIRTLTGQVKDQWPTPCVANAIQGANEPDGKRGQTIVGAVREWNWSTPRASVNENRQTKATPSQLAGEHGMNLATQVNFPTPTSRDGRASAATMARNSRPLNEFVTSGRQDQDNLSTNSSPRGQLNPDWVEILQGVPIGWTDCDSSETDASRPLSQKHG